MRAAFGLVSLLIVLATLAWLNKHAMRAVATVPASASAGASETPLQPTPQQQIEAVQRELNQAMRQAAARASEAEAP
jgi:hypothetical protein